MLPKGYHAYVLKYGARDGKRWGERAANMGTSSIGRNGQPIAPPAVGTDREVRTLDELEAAIAKGDVHPSVHDELRDIMRRKEARRRVLLGREREVREALAQESGRATDDDDLQRLSHYLVEMGMVHEGSSYVRSEPGFNALARMRLRVRLDTLLEQWASEDGTEPPRRPLDASQQKSATVFEHGARHGKRWGDEVEGIGTGRWGWKLGTPIPPAGEHPWLAVRTVEGLEAAIELGAVHPDVQDELREIVRRVEEGDRILATKDQQVYDVLKEIKDVEKFDWGLWHGAMYFTGMGFQEPESENLERGLKLDEADTKRLRNRLGALQDEWRAKGWL